MSRSSKWKRVLFLLSMVTSAVVVMMGASMTTAMAETINFSSGVETQQIQPTFSDTIAYSFNVNGYLSEINPECGIRQEIAHSGSKAVMYSGKDTNATTSFCYFKVFKVDIPITSDTNLSYWIYPQNENGRYVAVDFECSDGTTLRDCGATDSNGISMHPKAGRGTVNTWTNITSNVGAWLHGKTIRYIIIGYDRPEGTGGFRGYIDDIKISKASTLAAPAATWQEHWFEHNQLVKLQYYDDQVAVYFDDDMAGTTSSWIFPLVSTLWMYTKNIYGTFGSDPRLYVVVHRSRYSGGHPSTYFDSGHDYRNTIDVGGSDFGSASGWNIKILLHEVSHIVELASYGCHNSPSAKLWGDSKFAEIYQYDALIGMGMSSEARAEYDEYQSSTDGNGYYWFRDWFYPIWSQHGKAMALTGFFKLLGQYFPKASNGYDYARSLNWGEFYHFWSGAAGSNLKSQATAAFGWDSTKDSQWNAARSTFPAITSLYE